MVPHPEIFIFWSMRGIQVKKVPFIHHFIIKAENSHKYLENRGNMHSIIADCIHLIFSKKLLSYVQYNCELRLEITHDRKL